MGVLVRIFLQSQRPVFRSVVFVSLHNREVRAFGSIVVSIADLVQLSSLFNQLNLAGQLDSNSSVQFVTVFALQFDSILSPQLD